jgi:hypothetical protein
MQDSTGTTANDPVVVVVQDPGSQPDEPFFDEKEATGDVGATESPAVQDDDWGFSSAPAPVILVTEEEDWDFDSAPVMAETGDPMLKFKDAVKAAAERWLGHDWRLQLDNPASAEPTSTTADLSALAWKDELSSVKWEDTETYQRYHNTLKGMLGGHRAALLASVVKRTGEDHKEEDQPVPSSGTRQKRRERLSRTVTDDDTTNPFT